MPLRSEQFATRLAPHPTPSRHPPPKYSIIRQTGLRRPGIYTALIRQQLRPEFGPAHLFGDHLLLSLIRSRVPCSHAFVRKPQTQSLQQPFQQQLALAMRFAQARAQTSILRKPQFSSQTVPECHRCLHNSFVSSREGWARQTRMSIASQSPLQARGD